MIKIFTRQNFLAIYSGVLTVAFTSVVLLGARKSESNASFDQITVHRINVIEPDGTTRLVISDKAEFPGSYYHGKEYPRPDRDVTGMLFNNEEGTENGGLIFGGKKDQSGVAGGTSVSMNTNEIRPWWRNRIAKGTRVQPITFSMRTRALIHLLRSLPPSGSTSRLCRPAPSRSQRARRLRKNTREALSIVDISGVDETNPSA